MSAMLQRPSACICTTALCPDPMPSYFAQDNEEDVDLEVIRPATARRRSPDKLGALIDERPTLCEMVRTAPPPLPPSSHAATLRCTILSHAKAPLAISGQGLV